MNNLYHSIRSTEDATVYRCNSLYMKRLREMVGRDVLALTDRTTTNSIYLCMTEIQNKIYLQVLFKSAKNN
jgi:hypothetical protein